MSQIIAPIEKVMSEGNLLINLTGLFLEFEKAGDLGQSKKVKQLIKKLNDREYSIGFCGHFSAGKSSMINELVGAEILPSSPIPTSANLVKVQSSDDVARVFLFNGEVVEFPSPYNIEQIKKFCMNGQEVEWIEIGTKSSKVPTGVTILDTPGIDSVDDAHRISTESALHLADIIFYMMDYNHVQSEISFQFTKKLQEMKKPLYLIINQIDKHQETELSFHEFQEGVLHAFHNWGVKPDGIFYTSLKVQEHPDNQLSDLKSFLSFAWGGRDEALIKGIFDSAQTLILDHLNWVKEYNMEKVEQWEQHLSSLSSIERVEVPTKIESLKTKISLQTSLVTEQKFIFKQDLTKLLDNAYLMPFETRELAQRFLESEQPDFKVGFIFSKQKTDKEKEDRLQAFYQDLMGKVNSQINWHVGELLTKFCKHNQLPETLLNDVYEFKVMLEPSDIRETVKKGAKATGDALLNFTNDLAFECKRKYRVVALEIMENWLKVLDGANSNVIKGLENELGKYEKYKVTIQQLNESGEILKSSNLILMKLLNEGPIENVEIVKESILKSFLYEPKPPSAVFMKSDEGNNSAPDEEVVLVQELKHKDKVNSADMVKKIHSVTESLQHVKGLQTVVQQLKEKGARLANQSFTIALFGAFSAGKSSFANALMGTKLLPVSPNPTTATINKIKPVTAEFPHGTVRVQVKDVQQLEIDLEVSLKHFHLSFTTIEEALNHIQTVLKLEQVEPRQKPHYSFLKAVQLGYEQMRDHFGRILFVDLDQFGDFVANEEKSCFVEWIEVFYDCDLTRQGITLVDTPGADSINARHTGVAFEYIKNADAILFVTYYNHAFSKADREFLIQLGRVKDIFELDKMFFLINAADLASSKEELQLVQSYVSTQLLSYGIRKPRLFPISSLLALKEKQGMTVPNQTVMEDSGISTFEESFEDFIQHELIEMTVTSARLDLKRVHGVLNEYIQTALIGNEEKENRRNQLHLVKNEILTRIESTELEPSKKALEKEIKELLFYVKQRMFLRFTGMFNESFHPSVLSDENQSIKVALKGCLDELTESVAFDLSQELRATSVRIEDFIKKQLFSIHMTTYTEARKIHESLQLTYIQPPNMDLLDFSSITQDLDQLSISKPLALFKNTKTFFENNGKKKMRDDLEFLLQEPVGLYLEKNRMKLTDYYAVLFSSQVQGWKRSSCSEVDYYFEGLFDILSEKMDINELKNIETQVSEMV
ncbi:dynamin family protein [Bacillus sp. DJP31]|uniref:dynamin family protein n=1 Tax=Bacillus sp. DJP31 TaxID=3409789 RepID=UPI003BB5AC65